MASDLSRGCFSTETVGDASTAEICERLETLAAGGQCFTLVIDDPAATSHINGPSDSLEVCEYNRSEEQNLALGIAPSAEEATVAETAETTHNDIATQRAERKLAKKAKAQAKKKQVEVQGSGRHCEDGVWYDSDGDVIQTTTTVSTATQEDMMDFLNEFAGAFGMSDEDAEPDEDATKIDPEAMRLAYTQSH
eukprot:TRINITY_DN3351_c0_g1_i1.p1 TRINITY_DN3351_c0_g1~~TRINITY_DN3351_c0_g1_i1.p1  ORF type:complete len:193 (-),score=45.22 TRINITY_DN3351_c0_g1_i1:443-1021(-)